MNAAARLVNQNVISRTYVTSILLNRSQCLLMALIIAVLTSSLCIIYATNTSRNLNAAIQQTLAEREQLHIQWGQLLLEKSTQVMQARVQTIAEHTLGMVTPDLKSVVMIKE